MHLREVSQHNCVAFLSFSDHACSFAVITFRYATSLPYVRLRICSKSGYAVPFWLFSFSFSPTVQFLVPCGID